MGTDICMGVLTADCRHPRITLLSPNTTVCPIGVGLQCADVMLRLKREMYRNEEKEKLKEMHDKHAAVVCTDW